MQINLYNFVMEYNDIILKRGDIDVYSKDKPIHLSYENFARLKLMIKHNFFRDNEEKILENGIDKRKSVYAPNYRIFEDNLDEFYEIFDRYHEASSYELWTRISLVYRQYLKTRIRQYYIFVKVWVLFKNYSADELNKISQVKDFYLHDEIDILKILCNKQRIYELSSNDLLNIDIDHSKVLYDKKNDKFVD